MAAPGIKLIPIKPTVTQKQFAAVSKALGKVTERAAAELVKDHEKTTATWETNVRWTVRVSKGAVSVYTDNAIWRYVDQGTRPHIIRPKRAKMLAFQTGYAAKTRVGSIIASAGGPSGPAAFAREVQHPGTKARGFSRRLRSKWQDKWPKMAQAAIREALK